MSIEAFCEELFPLRIAFGTSGGPERTTEIVRLSTGYEHRNQRHRHAVRRYDAGSGVKRLADLVAVLDFFEARRGKLTGFRFRDPLDRQSCAYGRLPSPLDQSIGTGDGTTTAFALVKAYGTGSDAYLRPIEKPIAGTVLVAVDGAAVADGISVDAAGGIVGFAAPPAAGAAITAGFAFDVPVRFDMDHLAINVAAFEAGDIPSIPLIEVRP